MSDDPTDEPPRGQFVASADDQFTHGVIRGTHEIRFDEPEFIPVGSGTDEYPWPVDHLFASLVACQVSVLKQCLEKARIDEFEIRATADIDWDEGDIPKEMPENTAARIDHIAIDLDVRVPGEYESRAERCLAVYDRGCIVGQSLRAGIDYTPSTNLETI